MSVIPLEPVPFEGKAYRYMVCSTSWEDALQTAATIRVLPEP
jgi:hypothetical protein